MDVDGIIGHPSVGKVLLDLINTGNTRDKELAARLYVLIERLAIDPTGKNTPYIDVCEFQEFTRHSFFVHIVFRAKLIPFNRSDLSTFFRLLFICDDEMGCNVHLFLGPRPYEIPGWKSRVRNRYFEFQYGYLKEKYIKGETPLWSSV